MTYNIHWFRSDLRLHDNLALAQCCNTGHPVLFVYIHDPSSPYSDAEAHNVWLHYSLAKLRDQLDQHSHRLLFMRGDAKDCFQEILKHGKPRALYYNECYDEVARKAEQDVHLLLEEKKVTCYRYHGNLFAHPDKIQCGEGRYYDSYAPFFKALDKHSEERPLFPFPKAKAHPYTVHGLDLDDLTLIHSYHWNEYLPKYWKVGEAAALKSLRSFLKKYLSNYTKSRYYPGDHSTSTLSPHLAFGELSPYQVLHEVNNMVEKDEALYPEAQNFIYDLCKREFSNYLLYHKPDLPHNTINEEYTDHFWTENQYLFHAWKKGLTGYPIVDAAMRQMSQMGWCHARARIIASSFLVKDLKIHWREGQHWYFKNMFDADLAANAFNWQCATGCSSDCDPLYKAFNPVLHSEKYDPNGDYIRKWIPELAKLPTRYLHAPWKAPKAELKKANVNMGETYPMRIVDHAKVAKETLKALHARAKKVQKRKAKLRDTLGHETV